MIDQRHKHVTYGSSFKDFFKGFVDFTGYSSVPGHWFPVGSILGGFILLAVLVFQGVLSSFSSIGRRSTSDFGYLLGGSAFSDGVSTLQTGLAFGIFMLIAGLILILPLTASFTRRLRDVGFATWGIVILIALYYILSYFTVYLLTPVYCIVFLFVLMSLPSNAVETNSNSEFAKFFLRQTIQAQQYYSQFGNPFGHPVQFDQFGNPIQNQPYFNNGMNPGFQGQPQGFNSNAQQGRPNPGFQGQSQGFNPNAQQGRPNPGFQGQPQGFNPNAQQGQPGFQGQPQGFNPNAQQGRPNPGFQGQPQGFDPNAQQGRPNSGFQGQPQGFDSNAQQGRPNPGFQGQPQGFNPNAPQGGQQCQGFNPNAPQGGQQNPGFNVNEVQGQQQQAPEVNEVEEVVVEQQNVEVAPQVEVTQVEEVTPKVEVAPEIEEIHEVKVETVGGARSKRLQKLNKAEDEVGFKKRR
ncbi:hypothetical protein [uncultured Gemella sp.]|uniref:hypothetical protein n=1 Tax=uncultured Gemella sp. TaxID=254352 RepID=UPI0028D6F6AA|nr:hypothetical protein [uncultured Gemella sp.]